MDSYDHETLSLSKTAQVSHSASFVRGPVSDRKVRTAKSHDAGTMTPER